ncbi:MAG: DNA recombination protein RmuC [Akkermansiaceae bacterium]|nr:DNA recombination protein RmuC [Akkermansiaceae bacterium]
MPPELEPYLPLIVTATASLFIAWLITWLAASGAKSALLERLKAEERRNADSEARLAHAEAESQRNETQAQTFRNQLAETTSRLEAERKAAEEKQAMLGRAEVKLSDTFKALSADALKGASEQFLHLAKSTLASQTEEAKGDIEKRKTAIETLVKPIADSLGKFELRIGEIEKIREGAYSELKEQVRALGQGQLGLQKETASLVKALRQPTGRGQWGEMQLRRVVELAGMQEHCDFTLQTTTTTDEGKRLRPDMVVKLPGGKTIVVDSKTPMDAYLNALEATDDDERERFLTQHALQVSKHIKDLSSKEYTKQFDDTPEFTVLFLPSESFFSAALHSDPGLIEKGVDNGVILATPTTLIALLKAVAYGWRQEALALNAKEISALGRTMHERLGKLADHFAKLGNSLNSAVDHYNRAIGSYETRVMSTARKFEELKAAPQNASLPNLETIDKTTRPLLANPDVDIEAKDDFAFVPEKDTASKNAASDLRSAFEDF